MSDDDFDLTGCYTYDNYKLRAELQAETAAFCAESERKGRAFARKTIFGRMLGVFRPAVDDPDVVEGEIVVDELKLLKGG